VAQAETTYWKKGKRKYHIYCKVIREGTACHRRDLQVAHGDVREQWFAWSLVKEGRGGFMEVGEDICSCTPASFLPAD
jgi:hypothetical protein